MIWIWEVIFIVFNKGFLSVSLERIVHDLFYVFIFRLTKKMPVVKIHVWDNNRYQEEKLNSVVLFHLFNYCLTPKVLCTLCC